MKKKNKRSELCLSQSSLTGESCNDDFDYGFLIVLQRWWNGKLDKNEVDNRHYLSESSLPDDYENDHAGDADDDFTGVDFNFEYL